MHAQGSYVQRFGVDFLCLGKKFLVFNMVSRNLKLKYRRSVFGLFWTLLNPLALTFIYYFVFKVVMRVQLPHYLVFMLAGVLPWNFFAQSVVEGMESIVGSFGLISKAPIPVQVFPFVATLTNFVTLLLATPILIGAIFVTGVPVAAGCLLYLIYCGMLFFIAYGVALILAIAFVYLRDLRHIVGLAIQLWFYGTPVIYAETMIPAKYHWVLYANPLGAIFVGIHRALLEGGGMDPAFMSYALSWTLAITLAALIAQQTLSHELVEAI